MMASMETYLRQGRRQLQRWALEPRVQTAGRILGYGGSGFLLSAASLSNFSQPIAMGLICAGTGWRALVMCLGSLLGYGVFWGAAGAQGMVWSVTGCLMALLLGKREEIRDQPLMMPALAALMVAVTGLFFQLGWQDDTPVLMYFLRIALAPAAALLFSQVLNQRDAILDWMAGGVAVLALAQVVPIPYLGLGYIAGGALAVSGAFPAAALAGLGLDLAQVTKVPMTAVLCIAYFARMIPFSARWAKYAAPGAACLGVMAVCGVWDISPLPGLVLGGALGSLMPPRPEIVHRRGETGVAQVRLELAAGVLSEIQQTLLETTPPPIDEEALAEKARYRACASCSARNTCRDQERITAEIFQHPLDFECRKTGRVMAELRRGQEQLRGMKADRDRQREYRGALVQQYQFLSEYLRSLADQLPRRGERIRAYYRIEVSVRSAGKERANGDRCMAFSGPGCRYYVLLCDGMGTGLGAAQEGQSAGVLLRQMLTAGFPAEHAFRSINSILALRGRAGAVTLDLAEIRLDTGRASVYKWGAAPSWILRRAGAEKIGTATPPPGISVMETRETVVRLSLCRGEVLILFSDGVDGEEALRRNDLSPDGPPGELAARLLEKGCGKGEDDATAAVIRLRPAGMVPS